MTYIIKLRTQVQICDIFWKNQKNYAALVTFFKFNVQFEKSKNRQTNSLWFKSFGYQYFTQFFLVKFFLFPYYIFFLYLNIFPLKKQKSPINCSFIRLFKNIFSFSYPISDLTSVTSGTILFNIPSIPDFKVTVEDGHPLHEPCKITVTTPLLNDLNSMFPPSISTAGLT